jgi:cytochrome c
VKTKAYLFFVLVAVTVGGWLLSAEEEPSEELLKKGETLFTTKEALGVKYQCILCHKGEKAIARAEVLKLGDRLPDTINGQIIKQAKGKPIPKESEEMKALAAYILHKHSV